MPALPRLMLVADPARLAPDRLVTAVSAAAAAVPDCLVQLRWRDASTPARLALARRLHLPPARLVVNADAEAARALGCALQLPAGAPRPAAFTHPFGRSAHSVDEVRAAAREGAAWVVLGTIYETASKPGRPAAGLEIVAAAAAAEPALPIFAIGGIDAARAAAVLTAGAHGTAVSAAVLEAPDPAAAAHALAGRLHESGSDRRMKTVL